MNACNRRAKPADHKNKGLQALNFCFDVRKGEIEGLAYENQTRPDQTTHLLSYFRIGTLTTAYMLI